MVYLEQMMDSKLLWLACRHHVSELHIKHAYVNIMSATNSPEDPLFKGFKEWFISQRSMPGFPDDTTFRKYDWGEGAEVLIRRKKIES